MRTNRKHALLECGLGMLIVGIPYFIFCIVFLGQAQALADSGATTAPWYYDVGTIIADFPFLFALDHISDRWWRPVFNFFGQVFGSEDNAAMFAMVALDSIFWGFMVVFWFRFIRKYWARRNSVKGPYRGQNY